MSPCSASIGGYSPLAPLPPPPPPPPPGSAALALNRTVLSQLAEDGDLTGLSFVMLDNPETDEDVTGSTDDPYNAFWPGTFVPVNRRKNTE